MKKFKITTLILLWFTISISAQTKNEKESRIKLDDFPSQAQTVIKSVIDDVKRIRHYKEIDGKHESYESKFKYKKFWFSVEFDNSGNLEDIEVTIREKFIEQTARIEINSYLKNEFIKYDLIKIQEQYLSKHSTENQQFLNQVLNQRTSLHSNYEIIVAVKLDNG